MGWQGNMYPKGRENHPVINISWYAAKAYAEWAGKDLPTQAQWELAAKGTKQNMKYAWGNTDSKDNANYGRYNPKVSYRIPPTEAVGTYMPNEYGLYDMTGNVEEWCLDRLDVDDIHGRYHIIRGGSWFHSAEELDISRISQHPSNDGMATVGFRCVFVVDGTKTTNVVTDMTSWLSKEMMISFENTFNSLQKGKISKALFEKRMDQHINYFTGHTLDFERTLNDEFCKTIAEFNPDFQHEFPFKRTDHRLLLWKYYLEILIEHNDKSLMEILNIYRESLNNNIEDFFVNEGC